MSSANNPKRHTLEDELQRRLFDAEASPAPDLWARIDHELTVQENKEYKKKTLFYRQLAAACFVLFMLTGGLLAYFYSDEQQQQTMAVAPGAATSEAPAAENAEAASNPAAIASAPSGRAEQNASIPGASGAEKPSVSKKSTLAAVLPEESEERARYYNASTSAQQPSIAKHAADRTTAPDVATVSEMPEGSQPATGFPFSGRYRSITSQSITIALGSSTPQAPQQPAGVLREEPKSFLELNEQYKATRHQQDQQQAEILASQLNKENGKKQEQQTTRGGDSRWSLALAYAPTYFEQNIGLPDPVMASANNRTAFLSSGTKAIASEESYNNMHAAREEYEDKTEPAFSYTMEVKTGFKLKEKLKLLTGIGYSQSGARTKSNYIVRQFWVKPRTNERYDLEPSTIFLPALSNGLASDSISVARTNDAFNVEYKYRHLSIPVGLQYESDIAKDWFWYAGGGVAANFLLESSISASAQEVQSVSYTPKDEDSPFRKVQLSGNLSLGVGKRVSDNLTVVLGPELRNYFSTLVAEPENAMAPQGKPYAFGLSMGLNYQLSNGKK